LFGETQKSSASMFNDNLALQIIWFALEIILSFYCFFFPLSKSTLVHEFCLKANKKDKGSKQGLTSKVRIVQCKLTG
jgi:hypothetical protein